jgi:hypothetical protein
VGQAYTCCDGGRAPVLRRRVFGFMICPMRTGGLTVACVLALGCGISTHTGAPPDEQSGGTAGGSGASGAGGVGGTTAPGGGSGDVGAGMNGTDAGSALCSESRTLYCTDSCATPSARFAEADCVDGVMQCPPGMSRLDECPPESCLGILTYCCDFATGEREPRQCAGNGMLSACPTGFDAVKRSDLCAPSSVMSVSCSALNGTPCSDVDFECSQGGGCGGITCTCEPDGSDGLGWQCVTPPC